MQLVSVPSLLLSSYDGQGHTGGPRENLTPLYKRAGGVAIPEMAVALEQLHHAVLAAGGDFRITDCHRSAAVQLAARQKYEAWLKAGKPNPPGPGQKAAFVALPGKSNHNAGRAIDVDITSLKFPGLAKDKQLDTLWELAIPLGFTPIIKAPTEGASESWHFDFWGDLRHTYDRLGYEQAALCGALLVGHGGSWQNDGALLQAHCHRCGQDIGAIDAVVGARTQKAVLALLGSPLGTGAGALQAAIAKLALLPAKPY